METMTDRKQYKQFVLWIMGPTSSGKTTIARRVVEILRERGILVIDYDGDEVRDFFGPMLGFEKEDRLRVVRTIGQLANKAVNSGINVVVSALTANDDARAYVKGNVKNVILVYLDCSIEKCIERDTKGLYRKALGGEIATVIGINAAYKPFEGSDITINTENMSVDLGATELVERLGRLADM